MYKIRKITFINHPILGDLALDFCDEAGNCVDTVILAGENGTGKSTIINALYQLVSRTAHFEADVDFENDGEWFSIGYKFKTYENGNTYLTMDDGSGTASIINVPENAKKLPTSGVFSDVDINFHSNPLSAVTSLTLDSDNSSRRSTNDLPKLINQLLIDIQALDDAETAYAVKSNPDKKFIELQLSDRMARFTKAFDQMFEGLEYSRIDNRNGKKTILFSKNGKEVPIESLSSGEKQIVYRGCFLLKDAKATEGAFAFIDEPEISLHPTWQMRILDYYKHIFTNSSGKQTSQLFVVTHSPFIIHNETRKNDKVIVLARDASGNVIVKDKAEYYKCTSVEAIEDAFSLCSFSAEQPSVYLEGRTDEKYFNKATEVFGYKVPFRFKWVGYLKEGNEVNTGKDALGKAFHFLVSLNLTVKNVCLFDCDTHKEELELNNVYIRAIHTFENSKGMKIGVENALVLDGIDIEKFYSRRVKKGDYGNDTIITEFDKMGLCDYVCSMDNDVLKGVFANLKTVIDDIVAIYQR